MQALVWELHSHGNEAHVSLREWVVDQWKS